MKIEESDPYPDTLVRSMNPRIRIRIHTKISWIRNTKINTLRVFSSKAICAAIDQLGDPIISNAAFGGNVAPASCTWQSSA
jgi:hypothetical protein